MRRLDFAGLALPHLDALYRTARRLAAREAEDLVQQTYLEGQRSFATLRDPNCVRAWLFRILRNVWYHQCQRTEAVGGAVTEGGSANLEDEILAGGFSDDVERALRAMPEEFRTALLLVTVEELSYQEAAEAMDCPIGTVRSRVARARSVLAAELGTAAAPVVFKRRS